MNEMSEFLMLLCNIFFVFSEYPISELHPARLFLSAGYGSVTQLYTNIRSASDTVNQVIKMDQIWLSIFYGNSNNSHATCNMQTTKKREKKKDPQTHKYFDGSSCVIIILVHNKQIGSKLYSLIFRTFEILRFNAIECFTHSHAYTFAM